VTADKLDPRFNPRHREDVARKLAVPFVPKKDRFTPKDESQRDEEYAALIANLPAKMKVYQEAFNDEMSKFVNNEDSAIYLVYQPIWSCKTGLLSGLEVLCRIENGKDDAPMPALATFQADQDQLMLSESFSRKQLEFAAVACKQFPDIHVSVNIRPDQLASLKDILVAKALETQTPSGCSNLLIEVTEYAPICARTLALIKEMKEAGVIFGMDDVNEVRDHPPPAGMAGPSHACSFNLAMENASLFAVQKLATPMSCSVFRKEVFPTPEYAGGQAVAFLRTLILPEEDKAGIDERKKLVETWVQVVSSRNPTTQFVIECSVYEEDLRGNPDLYPDLPLFESPVFHIQGGRTGGRGFQLDAFMP